MSLNSLSGRFLILTILFVMLAEIMIFVPSIARFREDYLLTRLEKAQIASLALLAVDGMLEEDLEAELLENAGVLNVVLRRNEIRQLMLASPIPSPVDTTFDLRDVSAFELIRDALFRITDRDPKVIRVVGEPVRDAGMLIEITMDSMKLREAMIDYGLRILLLSAMISVVTAMMLYLAVRRLLVTPIKRVVESMQSYAMAPEDARRIIMPTAGVRELNEAETALQSMQTQLTGSLRQKERLAQLGSAVAKISHDLRNILTTAQLFADRMEMSKDPGVARAAPKLVNSISRAVSLCESTLAFGKAEEPKPRLERFPLKPMIEDLLESERLAIGNDPITFVDTCDPGLVIRADNEQLFRVLGNLVRNARQAISATGQKGEIKISANEDREGWYIHIQDTGPGLPDKARENLFQAFQGSVRKGGSGLGLAIAAELVKGHGGTLELGSSDAYGTTFTLFFPKAIVALEEAAE